MLGGQQRERVGGKQGDERGGVWGGMGRGEVFM